MIRRLPLLALPLLLTSLAGAQTPERWVDPQIVQARGADARVDYASLTRFGPWDDRNYQLTRADLELLAPNEAELRVAVPVFFRVAMRRANPDMMRSGPAQYPLSATEIFRKLYGGVEIDGELYRKTEYHDGRFYVLDVEAEAPAARRERLKLLDGEQKVSSPVGQSESAVKIHPRNPLVIVAGANDIAGAHQQMYRSTNGGSSWTTTGNLPRQADTCCDPTVDWSWDGRFAYAAALGDCAVSACEIWFYRSDDDGATWDDLGANPIEVSTGAGNDKEFLHVDKFVTSPFRDNLYMTWHRNNVLQFSRSTNDGATWSAPVAISGTGEEGIGSDIATDRNGNVYYIWPSFSQEILVRRSTDGGQTFGAAVQVDTTNANFGFPIPAMSQRETHVVASVDADLSNGPFSNTIYATWTDSTAATTGVAANNHARVRVAFSRNGGATWTVRTPHSTADQNTVDRFNPAIAVSADGVVHVVFYDTRRNTNRQSVDLFYNTSTDGGNTWGTPVRLSGQLSPMIADGFEWGDYNGLDVVLNNLVTVYTDNRQEGSGSGDSVDIYAQGIAELIPCNSTPSNLRAWFAMDSAVSSVMKNFAASSPNGTTLNGVSLQSGIVDAGYDFDGSNDYARASDHSTLDFGTSDLSIAAWIRTTDASATIVSKRWQSGSTYLGYLFMVSGGRLLLQLADANSNWANYTATSYPRVDNGDWHHVAVTVDRNSSTGGRFYIDGTLVYTFNPSNRQASISNSAALEIGRTTGGGNSFDGTLDEVQLYAKALTATEVESLYAVGKAGQCKPMEVTLDCVGNYNGSYAVSCVANISGGEPPYTYDWLYAGYASSWTSSGAVAHAYYNYPGCTPSSFNRFEVDVEDSLGQTASAVAVPVSCY